MIRARGLLRSKGSRGACRTVAQHEAAHVAALKKALWSKAVKRPSFDFQGTTGDQAKFAQTAITLEDTGVEAYQGQAGNIKTFIVMPSASAGSAMSGDPAMTG